MEEGREERTTYKGGERLKELLNPDPSPSSVTLFHPLHLPRSVRVDGLVDTAVSALT